MLLDTGADITLLPKVSCYNIGLQIQADESLRLTAFDGSMIGAEYTRLDMFFLGKRFRGKFLVYDNEEGLIGRDILNQFMLVFDGPNFEWEELETNNSSLS
jgi:hypothetical protein